MDSPKFLAKDGSLERETHVYALLAIAAIVQHHRAISDEAFFSKLFNYLQLAILAIAYEANGKLAFWYALTFLLMRMVMKQPEYNGPINFMMLNRSAYERHVVQNTDNVYWVVFFYSPTSVDSSHFLPVFAELSMQYKSEHLKFGAVNVGLFPSIAMMNGVKANLDDDEIPCLLLFHRGKLLRRNPMPGKQKLRSITLQKKRVIRFFGLDVCARGDKLSGPADLLAKTSLKNRKNASKR